MEKIITEREPITPEQAQELACQMLTQQRVSGVSVKGLVDHINDKVFAGCHYVTLKGGNGGNIKFLCPVEDKPNVGENIIVEGWLNIKSTKYGIEAQLKGSVKGCFERKDDSPKSVAVKDRFHPNMPLVDFITNDQLPGLLVVYTSNGLHDYRAKLYNRGLSVEWEEVEAPFESPLEMMDIVREKLTCMPQRNGVAFLRGGGDDHRNNIWNSPEFINQLIDLHLPFYIAVGHAKTRHLADMHADQWFTTATDFGDRLASGIQLHKRLKQDKEKFYHIQDELNGKVRCVEFELNSLRKSKNKWVIGTTIATTAAIISLLLNFGL